MEALEPIFPGGIGSLSGAKRIPSLFLSLALFSGATVITV